MSGNYRKYCLKVREILHKKFVVTLKTLKISFALKIFQRLKSEPNNRASKQKICSNSNIFSHSKSYKFKIQTTTKKYPASIFVP